ncbi:MAG TPA: hypothetical protein DIW24_06100 [Bacteroidetes bacterium]|nr:hypothetical protein [Bacteroidota bacterium]
MNTERLRVFGDKPGWNHSFQTTFAYASGNSNFARISGTWRTDFERKPRELMLVANFERGISNDKRYVNKGFGHVRALYRVTEPLKAEVFLQKEYNEFTRLQDRQLAGAGLRWKMIADAHMGQNPKSGVWMYLGIGGMYEAEKIKNEPTETTHLFRSTNYLTIYIDLGNHVSLNAIGYIQVAPAHLKDVRILAENNVTVNLAKNIALTSGMSFRYDNQPPANVKPHDFSLMQGLRVLF